MSDLAILTKKKKVTFEEEEGQIKSVTLYPFAFKYFNDAISIINKYFECYTAVKEEYDTEVQFILGNNDYDENTKEKKLLYLKSNFDEVEHIVRNILSSEQSSLAEDISSIIDFCSRDTIDLNQFHWGEIGVLLAAAIEVNLDFFEQNKSKIPLLKISEKPPLKKAKNPQNGESKSAS